MWDAKGVGFHVEVNIAKDSEIITQFCALKKIPKPKNLNTLSLNFLSVAKLF